MMMMGKERDEWDRLWDDLAVKMHILVDTYSFSNIQGPRVPLDKIQTNNGGRI